jgi:phytoene dehydrogenase-like protein
MAHEVVVVGGGFGGLTVAALLAARGVDVCLLERDSVLGGCAANVHTSGYSFEPGMGLYSGWEPEGIFDRVFSELTIAKPEVLKVDLAYVVRLPDKSEVALTGNKLGFEENLIGVFPECANEAVKLYRSLESLGRSVRHAFVKAPDLQTAPAQKKIAAFFPNVRRGLQANRAASEPFSAQVNQTSPRFRRFLDIQLAEFGQTSVDQSSHLFAALILSSALDPMFTIPGGASALADVLANSVRASGGKIRLDTPVLRLARDSVGKITGVDLLSGETVQASRAIVSNLTVWDTYGKLVGLSQTPTDVRKQLDSLTGFGAYLILASMKSAAAKGLPCDRILTLSDWQEGRPYDAAETQLTFAVASEFDQRTPDGERAVTIHAITDANDWFGFHEDESEHERQDQKMLEECWTRLHTALPELGSDIEIIETATPQTYYQQTRRKLGQVGGVHQMARPNPPALLGHRTSIPNFFRVGDTTFPGGGLASVAQSALIVANILTS